MAGVLGSGTNYYLGSYGEVHKVMHNISKQIRAAKVIKKKAKSLLE